jgi:uncharacterized protein (DUF1499 family)
MNDRPTSVESEPRELRPCANPHNCAVDSPENRDPALRPIDFHTTPEVAMNVIESVLKEHPRTRIVVQGWRYLHAESRSLVFRFVDDVEFLVDESAALIHFRSASRVGRRDFGVNRRRLLRLTGRIRTRLSELLPRR